MRASFPLALLLISLSAKPATTLAQAPATWTSTWGETAAQSRFGIVSHAPTSGGVLAGGQRYDSIAHSGTALVSFVPTDARADAAWTYQLAPAAGQLARVDGLAEVGRDSAVVAFTEYNAEAAFGRGYAVLLTREADGSVREGVRVAVTSNEGDFSVAGAAARIPGTSDYVVTGTRSADGHSVDGYFLTRMSAHGQRLGYASGEDELRNFVASDPKLFVVADTVYLCGSFSGIREISAELSTGFQKVPLPTNANAAFGDYTNMFLTTGGQALGTYRNLGTSAAASLQGDPEEIYRWPSGNRDSPSTTEGQQWPAGIAETATGSRVLYQGLRTVSRVDYDSSGAVLGRTAVAVPEALRDVTRGDFVFYPALALGADTVIAAGYHYTADALTVAALRMATFGERDTVRTLATLPTPGTADPQTVRALLPRPGGGVRAVVQDTRGPAVRSYSDAGELLDVDELPIGRLPTGPNAALALDGGRFAYLYSRGEGTVADPTVDYLAVVDADGRQAAATAYETSVSARADRFLFPGAAGGVRVLVSGGGTTEFIDFSADLTRLSTSTLATGLYEVSDALPLEGTTAVALLGVDSAGRWTLLRADLATEAIDFRGAPGSLGEWSPRLVSLFDAGEGRLGLHGFAPEGRRRAYQRILDGGGEVVSAEEFRMLGLPDFASTSVAPFAGTGLPRALFTAQRPGADAAGLPLALSEVYLADADAADGYRVVSAVGRGGFTPTHYREFGGRTYLAGTVATPLAERSVLFAYGSVLSPAEAVREGFGESLTVYPNPAASGAVLSFGESETLPAAVTLTDATGRTVAALDVEAGSVRLPYLPAGVYQVRGTVAGRAWTRQLVVR